METIHDRDERLPLVLEASPFVTLFGLVNVRNGNRIVCALPCGQNPQPQRTIKLSAPSPLPRKTGRDSLLV